MSKTIELRETIHALLKNKCSNVYYRRASIEKSYPHIVYEIRNIGDTKILEINYWDIGNDTVNLENIADETESLLDNTQLSNENHTLYFESMNDRKWLDDEDKTILRINESFEVRYYGRESK